MFKVERGCQRYIELSGSHARSVTGRLRSVRYEKVFSTKLRPLHPGLSLCLI